LFPRLRFRIAAYFAVLIVVLMAVVLFTVNLLVGRNTSSVIQLRFNEASLLLEQQLANNVRWLTSMGQVASRAPRLVAAVSTADPPTVLDAAESISRQLGSELITVVGANGRVLARVHDPERWGDDVSPDSMIAAALSGETGNGLISSEGLLYQAVTIPLVTGFQEVSGALRLGFRIDDEFARKLKNLTGTDITFLLSGRVVASSLDSAAQARMRKEMEEPVRENPVEEIGEMVKGRDESFHGLHGERAFDVFLDGERYRCAMVDLPSVGASYVIQRSIDRERAYQSSLQGWLIAVGLAAIMVAALLSFLLARGITRPISRLAELSKQVAAGDLDVSFLHSGHDEIGELADSFNAMADHLRQYLEELEGHRRNLELKVEERTSELERANLALEERNYRLRELSELSLASFEDEDGLFRGITQKACELLGADMAVLARSTPEGGRILALAGEATDAGPESGLCTRFEGMLHEQHDQEILLYRFDSPGENPSGFRTGVMADINLNSGRFGSLCLMSRRVEAFTPQHLEVLGILRRILSSEMERREWERQILSYAKQVENANRAKSEFLANMSHELRTPLNAIIGFSELMSAKSFGELNEKYTRYVNNVLTSGRHLLTLINGILDLSKVEAGVLDLNPERFALADALNVAESMVRGYAAKKNIRISFEIPERPEVMYADQTRFRQILYNLLSNAVKFTPEGGQVTLSTSLLSSPDEIEPTRGLPTAAYLMVNVVDTGIGIAPEHHDLVWAEFRQVDSSYARKQEGTGLGLALTRRLVELQGGRVWFESEPGHGTVFHFVLPVEGFPSGQDHLPTAAGMERKT